MNNQPQKSPPPQDELEALRARVVEPEARVDENLGDRLDAFYDTPRGRLIIMIIGVVVTVILIRLFD